MPLFQKSVLNKFIKSQDASKIEESYQRYSNSFQRPERQLEIRSMKEEEYQDGFLDDLFVNILGYIKRPNDGYNLVREKKNEADSKKADGAILKNNVPLAVIELKGTETRDLDKVTNQGFGYKNNNKECVYVITSNFEKLRFYIHNAVEHIEFNLFTLTKDEFVTLWLCLHSDNLLDNIPAKIKDESVVKEEDITKNLYKDYSSFKQELWQSIVNLNPDGEPLMFYKKTQKLIDRFLFIFFAEDAGLLPPNSISRMVDRWKMLKDEDAYKPLYQIFKQYFGYINTGRQGKTPQDEIFAYNGGLMLEDDVLDNIFISDEVLLKHVTILTTYDFSSEVDVNILGHIFENSLNDIDAVTAQLEGLDIDKSKTKRKKDGVFYTPKYITKYIVDNTIGLLCDEKKLELNIIDEQYAKGRNNRKKETIVKLDENLQSYRNWLLNITICDPACGSGAFLNQALEYLIEEHRYIDELESQLLDGGFTFPGVENHILENNIFGVDINEESIEIAKLSLWLRTAQRGRKLTSLNKNIKCGNSLIDDSEVAGEKAFNWKQEFPTVFEKGGFDVVIGNPPYVQIKESNNYFNSNYSTVSSGDLYALFFEKALSILTSNGTLGFITPSSYMTNIGFVSLRDLLLKYKISQLIDLGANVFKDASVDSAVIIVEMKNETEHLIKVGSNLENLNLLKQRIFNELDGRNFNIYLDPKGLELCNKIESRSLKFENHLSFSRGVEFGFKSEFVFDEKKNENFVPIICGGNISKQHISFENKFIVFDDKEQKIYKARRIYETEKILVKRIGNKIIGSYDDKGFYNVCDVYNIQLKSNDNYNLKSISSIINSKFINFYYDTKFKSVKILFPKIPIQNLKLLPIPKFNVNSDSKLVELTEGVLDLKNQLHLFRNSFTNYLVATYNLKAVSSKLKNWFDISFTVFIQELNKYIKIDKGTVLTKKEEFEWLELFENNRKKVGTLHSKITEIDKAIDSLVFELYELTEEEIKLVESL